MNKKLTGILLGVSMGLTFLAGSGCRKETPNGPPPAGGFSMTYYRTMCDGEEPAVSPDGKKIAYSNNGHIFVMDTSVEVIKTSVGILLKYDTTGGTIRQLTSGNQIDLLPRWSPDGQTIGFMRVTQQTDADGKILFVSTVNGNVSEIPSPHYPSAALKGYVESGGGVTLPLWDFSPDGSFVAFLAKNQDTTYLSVLSLSTYREVLFEVLGTNANNSGYLSGFAWSLNSNEICFIEQNNSLGRAHVHLLNFSTHAEQIDSSLYDSSNLTRDINSNRFAYLGSEVSSPLLSYFNLTDFTSIPTRYTNPGGGGGLKWSPDEKYFLFDWQHRLDPPLDNQTYSKLYVYSIGTQEEYNLIDGDLYWVNLYFDWGKAPNTIFCERYKTIDEVRFVMP